MEKYKKKKKNLYMNFIDLQKAYDKLAREVLWQVSEKKEFTVPYANLIKDVYGRSLTSIRATREETKKFPLL